MPIEESIKGPQRIENCSVDLLLLIMKFLLVLIFAACAYAQTPCQNIRQYQSSVIKLNLSFGFSQVPVHNGDLDQRA